MDIYWYEQVWVEDDKVDHSKCLGNIYEMLIFGPAFSKTM